MDKELFTLEYVDGEFRWLIKKGKDVYTAGNDVKKVISLIDRLNKAHRPNVRQDSLNKISVCWNNHDKHEGCIYLTEI